MARNVRPQSYIRIQNEKDKYYGYLDISSLVDHEEQISIEVLKQLIVAAIDYAHKKSSRAFIEEPGDLDEKQLNVFYAEKGKALFHYFIKYCGDPASTAYDCVSKHYTQIAKENFRNNTIQKERMNAGWRYQHIAKEAARLSARFDSVSDLNLIEADFNAVVSYRNTTEKLSIYVSVKNRSNTMGGQDWPKAIYALESAAMGDKNRRGNYICVFGIAMEKGQRNIKTQKLTKQPYSHNTEVWFSDFFWPFFSNFTYEQISKAVLDVLISDGRLSSLDIEIPDPVIIHFGEECKRYGLLDENGRFNDAHRLVELFCGSIKI